MVRSSLSGVRSESGGREVRRRTLWLDVVPAFKPGDQPPTGYIERDEWASVQLKAGLRQKRCPVCRLYKFPQEKCCKVGGK